MFFTEFSYIVISSANFDSTAHVKDRLVKRFGVIILTYILLALPGDTPAELLMHTHGNITIAPYIHGFDRPRGLYPGYRSEFMTYVDFLKAGRFVFNSLLGTTTIISDTDDRGMKLDRIRYTLSPGFRYERDTWLIKGSLHHECIHTINRPEYNGSVWWNCFQIGVGTKGAYYLYLREVYKNKYNEVINRWDAQINAGWYIPAKRTLFSGQNHDYRWEEYSLIRYHLGSFRRWAYFAGVRQSLWIRENGDDEHQISITLNVFRRGLVNFAGFYYTYMIYDTYELDNADGLGSIGFRILF